MDVFKQKLNEYCVRIGKNPLMVQGPGGNVSFKKDGVMWIKASGMCLKDALKKDIFVPVDVDALKKDIASVPKVLYGHCLKPSIETAMHAVMPYSWVAHVHDVDVLSYLVQEHCDLVLNEIFHDQKNWCCVEYVKPGVDLARKVGLCVDANPRVRVVFLKNHGWVVAGDSLEEIEETMSFFKKRLPVSLKKVNVEFSYEKKEGYEVVQDSVVQWLVCDEDALTLLKTKWALYPDHVVFLGVQPFFFESWEELKNVREKPSFIFIKNTGVFMQPCFSEVQKEMLRCYADVVLRINDTKRVSSLSEKQVYEIVCWDDEIYRKRMMEDD